MIIIFTTNNRNFLRNSNTSKSYDTSLSVTHQIILKRPNTLKKNLPRNRIFFLLTTLTTQLTIEKSLCVHPKPRRSRASSPHLHSTISSHRRSLSLCATTAAAVAVEARLDRIRLSLSLAPSPYLSLSERHMYMHARLRRRHRRGYNERDLRVE